MYEIQNDVFFDEIRRYDPDIEYHIVGEVEYHLLADDQPYRGLRSHTKALTVVFDHLTGSGIEDQKTAGERFGDETADILFPWIYDIGKARAKLLDPNEFFYCPNILKIDHYGIVFYDAVWRPNDENFGTTVPYWYALMEPVQGRRNKPEDFKKVNEALFPKGTDSIEIYEWSTDWSNIFDAGHEWYGACCWSIYDKKMDRYAILLVSATD